MERSRFSPRQLTRAALIAALYVALSALSAAFGLAFGPIQFRLSEALCVLPFLFPEAIPGLAVGCLLTNLLSPYGPLDMIFGPLATLLAALWVRNTDRKWLTPLPTAICNAGILGTVLTYQQIASPDGVFLAGFCYNALTVGLGELAVGFVLGLPLLMWLSRRLPPQ